MNFKELIVKNKENIDQVLSKLIEYYPDFEEFFKGNILSVYNKLAYMEKNNKAESFVIVVESVDNDEDEDAWFDVFGKKNGDSDKYALELNDWSDWLNYEIDHRTLNNLGEIDTIAHCIYELTFFGTEENMVKEREKLQEILENIDYSKCKSYKSVEEMLKDLENMEDEEDE